jgi:S1-C subfamily serine protease/thiol-disulfide isomerase/thioredoxin
MSIRTLAACCAALISLIVGAVAEGQDEIGALIETRRQWTVATPEGPRKLDAELIGLKQGALQFREADGKSLNLPLDQLTQEDRRAALTDRVGSGVVAIATKDVFDQPVGLGSGFVMHESGLILTNYHVIAGAAAVEVAFRDHAQTQTAEVLSVDRLHDVAFLRVNPLPERVHVVELQSTELPIPGASVWTLGHPGGLKNTVGWGDVNAVRKTSELPEALRNVFHAPADSRWLQTNAVLARGSSGGPLLNERGQAVGINTLVVTPQIGFAIHISHARQAYSEARNAAPQTLPLPPSDEEDALAWTSRSIAPLLKAYSQEYEKLSAAAAQLPPEEVQSRLETIHGNYREQFLQLAKTDPRGWPGVQALAYAAQLSGSEAGAPALAQVCQLALEHHRDHRHLSSVVTAVAEAPTNAARDFCRRVREVSPHETVRVHATTNLAVNLLRWIQAPDSIQLPKLQAAREEVTKIIDSLEKGQVSETVLTEEARRQLAAVMRERLELIPIGVKAREIEGIDIEGQRFKLSDYQGKVVLLDFFADWCPYCRAMYPGERAMVEKLKDRPFALLGVHCESQQVLDELVKRKAVTWRCWADGDQGPITVAWGVETFPTMFLVDRLGVVRWMSNGLTSEEELAKLVDQLLAEADAPGGQE